MWWNFIAGLVKFRSSGSSTDHPMLVFALTLSNEMETLARGYHGLMKILIEWVITFGFSVSFRSAVDGVLFHTSLQNLEKVFKNSWFAASAQ
jgi:hypothetical protein